MLSGARAPVPTRLNSFATHCHTRRLGMATANALSPPWGNAGARQIEFTDQCAGERCGNTALEEGASLAIKPQRTSWALPAQGLIANKIIQISRSRGRLVAGLFRCIKQGHRWQEDGLSRMRAGCIHQDGHADKNPRIRRFMAPQRYRSERDPIW